jgi:peptide/nickel transport system permease protein
MSVGTVAVGISLAIGFTLGGLAGYLGGRVDMIIMRFTDIMMTFPTFVLMLIMAAILEPSIFTIMAVIGLFSWPGLARLVRGQVLSIREQEYVLAARVVGSSDSRILIEHVLPNVIGPVVVSMTMGVAGAILSEAGLSFLGIGIQPPRSSWGAMISRATNFTVLTTMPWRWLSAGVAITLAVLSFNFVGDGLRDALDVRGEPGQV